MNVAYITLSRNTKKAGNKRESGIGSEDEEKHFNWGLIIISLFCLASDWSYNFYKLTPNYPHVNTGGSWAREGEAGGTSGPIRKLSLDRREGWEVCEWQHKQEARWDPMGPGTKDLG